MGCILYEPLSGSYPFMATSMTPSAWTRLHRRGPDWSRVKGSKHARTLCKAMLQFTEEARPTMRECCDNEWFNADKTELKLIPPHDFAHLAAMCQTQQMKRMILLEVASRLPMARATEIVETFRSLDDNRDGTLSPEEFVKLFEKMGIDDPQLARDTFKALDADSDGSLTFTEFASGALLLFQDKFEESLHSLFNEHDPNGDGALDWDEAESFLDDAFQGMTIQGKPQDSSTFIGGMIAKN